MGRKLLIVASKRYGDYVKEIAESMGCFEEISFVDNDREGAIGKLEDVESFYPEYNCAIAACDDGTERLEWNKKLETLYNIPVLAHMDSNLMPGCIVEPRAVIGCGSTIGQATIIGANVVVEPYCFIGDSCTLKSGTIVKSTSMVAMNTSTEQGSVLFTSLTKD